MHIYAQGDVIIRAYVLGPKTAHVKEAISVHLNGTQVRIAPEQSLVEGLVTDVTRGLLFAKKGQTRSATPVAFCLYRAKSAIQHGLLGKQNFEHCFIDQDNDGTFDATFLSGNKTAALQPIQPTRYLVKDPVPDPSNRIEISFSAFAGNKTIILQTSYFLQNRRQKDVTRLFVNSTLGTFDYQGGPFQGGRCFYRRPDETLVGRIRILGVPVAITGAHRIQKTIEASVGIPIPASLFVADASQRWIPNTFQSCGDEPN